MEAMIKPQRLGDLSHISSEIGEAIAVLNFFKSGDVSTQRLKELSKKVSSDLSAARLLLGKIIEEADSK
jgi:hypothetical protein